MHRTSLQTKQARQRDLKRQQVPRINHLMKLELQTVLQPQRELRTSWLMKQGLRTSPQTRLGRQRGRQMQDLAPRTCCGTLHPEGLPD